MRLLPSWAYALIAAMAFVSAPYIGVDATWTRQLTLIAIFALVVSGLNLSWGYAGELNLGQVAMYSLGAYLAGILAINGYGLVFTIPAVILATSVMGLIVGLPGLRIGGWGLAMASFFLVILIPDAANIFESYSGGYAGLAGIPPASLFGHDLKPNDYYVLVATITVAWFAILRNIVTSRHGHALQVMRESPVLATSLGISVFRLKLLAYVIGAIPAGIAGALYANLDHFIAPEIFDLNLTVAILAAAVLGGTHSIYGALLGATIMQLGPLRITAFKEFALIAYGVFLVISGIFFSGGLTSVASKIIRLVRPAQSRPSESPRSYSKPAVQERIPGALLQVASVSKDFGGVRALNEVSLSASPGKVTGLIGANGSGKTTLLNIISGFYIATSGQIKLGDKQIAGLGAREIAHVGVARTFQTPLIPSGMTTLEAVGIARYEREKASFIGAILRLPGYKAISRRDRDQAMAMLALLGIEDLADRPASSLPLGSRRLVEVARALVARPAVILLDEPASGLDESEVEKLASAIRTIRDAGCTVVLVEHNYHFICDVSDKICVLNLGNLIAEGTPQEINSNAAVAHSYLGQLPETATTRSHQ